MVVRYGISIGLVAVALMVTAVVFLFARPQYRPQYESKMIDFSEVRYYSPTAVREAFATEGILLRVAGRFGGFLTLSNTPHRLDADALQVQVGPRTGTGSYGPELEPYDERFGNLLVTYGGTDEHLLERVEAAVEALR